MEEAVQAMSSCFDGNGLVTALDSESDVSYKLVKDLRPEDKVYAHDFQIATVALLKKKPWRCTQ